MAKRPAQLLVAAVAADRKMMEVPRLSVCRRPRVPRGEASDQQRP